MNLQLLALLTLLMQGATGSIFDEMEHDRQNRHDQQRIGVCLAVAQNCFDCQKIEEIINKKQDDPFIVEMSKRGVIVYPPASKVRKKQALQDYEALGCRQLQNCKTDGICG